MLTVLEAINLSTEFLEKKEIESPRINAELLLAHALNCKRLDLYLSYDRPLNEDEVKLYREFIRRRIKSEPLQYIIGKVEFYGIEFNVNPSVLIPRQETEILVETIINSVNKDGSLKILDVGVGSGNISISLAKHLPYSKITATDISEQALETAKANAEMNNVLEKINFIKHDILSHNLNDEFDIVVSNPPYISREEFPQLKDELKVYEPQNALTDFSDGLNYYRIISSKAKEFVKSKGKIFFEVGQGQVEDVKRILAENNFNEISIVKDYLKIDRVISGVKN
ncbi:MAG: protein-(glutamine-N5) methyltransferase, release factor-specific [Ignavibacteria bacterium GWA2_35_9]|nr:MAG: protein-(glutamine-N5) methyltransferase, release factor-specific [Ignavibacteria bacterium GWA2_35_9]